MPETSMGGARGAFELTLWTRVLKARDGARDALEHLVRAYWKPVYFAVRRWGAAVEDAKDLTQGFFAEFFGRDFLRGVSRGKGRFRTFLLTALRNFLVNEKERAGAKKRGGGKAPLRLDFAAAETEYALEPAAKESIDDFFKRQWALTVLERALDALARETPPERFEAIRPHLAAGEAPAYEDTARRLGVSAGDVKNLLHRARRRYRELIRAEVSASVHGDVGEELRDLFAAL